MMDDHNQSSDVQPRPKHEGTERAKGSGAGSQCVRVPGILLTTIHLVGRTLLALNVLIALWPIPAPAGTVPGDEIRVSATGGAASCSDGFLAASRSPRPRPDV